MKKFMDFIDEGRYGRTQAADLKAKKDAEEDADRKTYSDPRRNLKSDPAAAMRVMTALKKNSIDVTLKGNVILVKGNGKKPSRIECFRNGMQSDAMRKYIDLWFPDAPVKPGTVGAFASLEPAQLSDTRILTQLLKSHGLI